MAESRPTADNIFLNPIQHGQPNIIVSALISPRSNVKFPGKSKAAKRESQSDTCMLMQFAESTDRLLTKTQGKNYLDIENPAVTERAVSAEEMMMKESMYEFKQTLQQMRSDQDITALPGQCTHSSGEGLYHSNVKISSPRANAKTAKQDKQDKKKTGSIQAFEERMRPWIELTKVDVDPSLPPRRDAAKKTDKDSDADGSKFPKVHKSIKKRISDFSQNILVTEANANSVKLEDAECVSFTFQYLIITERLKVTVINARNLFKTTENPAEANSYAEVCLFPGKIQLQTSDLVRRSKDPTFRSVFFFRGFSLEEMHQMNLRIRLMGKQNILYRSKIIGEVVVSLENFDLISENLLDEQLHTRIVPAKSGSIRHVMVK